MRIIGFTGSRDLSDDEVVLIERILWTLQADRVVTGACVGVDEFVSEWFLDNRNSTPQTIYVPSDRSRVNMPWISTMMSESNVEVHFMPPGSSYLHRNLQIVNDCDLLIAFPRYYESHPKSRRSGTWQTIRRAKLAGKQVKVHVLTDRLLS